MFKKVLAIILAAVLLCGVFAGCGSKKEDGKYKIGVVQLLPHDALDAATKGFQDALKEKLGDKVEFDVQYGGGEKTNCTNIVSNFISDKVDLIMANATDALAAAAEGTDTIPIVATSITDYATALGMKDWDGTTGFNVTGTSDLTPSDKQAAIIKELVPDAKKVGIIYCSNESNSKYQADEMKKELIKLGFAEGDITFYTFTDTNDINAVAQTAVDESDVIYIPTDNTAANNTKAIDNIAEPAGIPIIAGEEGICKGCGVATLSISYYDLGYKTGEMAYDILVNGSDPATMKIQTADATTKRYVESRAAKLNITIPDGYEKIEE